MAAHPVQLRIERSTGVPRVQVLVRFVLALAITTGGVSSIFWLLYRLWAYHLCLVDRYPSIEETITERALGVG